MSEEVVEIEINFDVFMEQVNLEQVRDESLSIERAVDLTFESHYPHVNGVLELDHAPDNDLENRVFQAIVIREEMFMLAILENVEASTVPEILDQIQQNLSAIAFYGMHMTGSQADIIFEKMHDNNLLDLSVQLRKDYCQGFVRALVGFIQNSSSVDTLVLTRQNADDWVTEETFQSLCAGILGSSVESLTMDGLHVQGHRVDKIHKILAELIENPSSSIKRIECETFPKSTFLPGQFADYSIELLSRTLCQAPSIRNLDMSFRARYSNDGYDSLILNRHPWWKQHLGDMDTVPLKLLPLVLEKADTWKCDTSHSHLDVLFFLLKEKNPVLLQNVRRRRIRKRKRYGFDS